MTKPGELSLFIPINKIDEEQRLVYGQVAAEVLDNSGEMFDYDGSKEYFEKWSDNAYATSGGRSYGNVRVMHTSKVAGLVSSPLAFNDDDKIIEAVAKVVDDGEWEMVKAGGYTGFSMGGRYVSRAKKSDGITRYVADPVEISLVDKPCIPTAVFSVVKADGIVEERRFRDDLYKGEWNEDDHPRDENGKFGDGGGNGVVNHPDGSRTVYGKDWQGNPTERTVGAASAKHSDLQEAARHASNRMNEAAKENSRLKTDESKAKYEAAKEESDKAHAAVTEHFNANKDDIRANKSDTGEQVMTVYTPTNDEVLPVARALAKAAGHDDDKWVDFVEEATADLIAKHAEAEAGAVVNKFDAEHADENCPVENCDKCAAAKADKPFPSKDKEEGEKDGDDENGNPGEEADDEAKKAAEIEALGLRQVWQAPDGSVHAKKADAVTHMGTVNKAAEPSLVDQLKSMSETVDQIAKGEVVAAPAEEVTLKAAIISAISGPLAKFKEFHENTLVKGMYSLRRLAEVIAGLDELHCMVSCEEAWEDDQTSKLPQMLLDGMKTLGAALVAMATEEVNEMLVTSAAYDTRDGVTEITGADDAILALSATTLGLEKSDFISGLAERLQKRAPVVPADKPETLEKLAAAEASASSALEKAAKLEGELAEIAPLVKGLQLQIEQIKALPAAKAPTTRVVTKSDDRDGGGGPTPPAIDLNKFSGDQLADAAIRLSHQHGRHFIMPNQPGGQ